MNKSISRQKYDVICGRCKINLGEGSKKAGVHYWGRCPNCGDTIRYLTFPEGTK